MNALGVGRGDRVAVLSLNQDRYVELYLGVAWAGAVIVPLNIRWSAPENEDALRDSRPKVLVVDAAFSGAGAALAQKTGSIRLVYADDAPAASEPHAARMGELLPSRNRQQGVSGARRLHSRAVTPVVALQAQSQAADASSTSPGLATACNRAAMLTPSPIRSPSLSSTTSPIWIPTRYSILRSDRTPGVALDEAGLHLDGPAPDFRLSGGPM